MSTGKLKKNSNQLLSEMLRYRVDNFNHMWMDISLPAPSPFHLPRHSHPYLFNVILIESYSFSLMLSFFHHLFCSFISSSSNFFLVARA